MKRQQPQGDNSLKSLHLKDSEARSRGQEPEAEEGVKVDAINTSNNR